LKAALYTEFGGAIEITSVPDPAPSPTGVVVRVEATGVCRSDWHGWRGHDPDITLPHVPGHEFAGIIEAVGRDVHKWKKGDRVTAPFVCGCGKCSFCRSGNQQVCPDQFQPGFTAWGTFAEYVMLEYADENLVGLPDELDFVTAASLGCRLATSYRAVVQQARIQPEHWIAVHGCGGVGLSAIMIARALGARPIAVDIDPGKLDLALQLGASDTVNAAKEDVTSSIMDLTDGGAHCSMDALGSPVTALNSIRCLRPRGRHIQVGLMAGDSVDSKIPFDLVVARELELFGSHGMPAHSYPGLLRLISRGQLNPSQLTGRTSTLEDALAALVNEDAFHEAGILVINRV
tara:strand:- start:46 stop:1083 length:1038 start_codon:yes stop_codon:yes gene_type:complete